MNLEILNLNEKILEDKNLVTSQMRDKETLV